MSCFRYGFHTWIQYSNCCLTNDLYNHSIVSWSLVTIVLLIPNHTWCKLKELQYIVSWIHFVLCISCVSIGLKVEISVYLCLHVGPYVYIHVYPVCMRAMLSLHIHHTCIHIYVCIWSSTLRSLRSRLLIRSLGKGLLIISPRSN